MDKINKKKLAYPICFFLFALLGNISSSFFLVVAFLVVICEVIFGSIEENFYFSFLLIPNIRILDATGVSFLVNILMVLPALKYLIIRKLKIQKLVLTGAFIFMFIELTHILVLGYYSRIIPEVCWIMAYIMCASILVDQKIFVDKKNIALYLSTGIIGSSIVYLVSNMSYASNIIADVIDGSRFEAYADDPNFFSLYICLTLAMILSIHNKRKSAYINVAVLIIIGLLTASKMCLLLICFIISAVVVIQILSNETKYKDHRFMRNIIVILLGCGIAFRNTLLEFINNLLRRAGLIGSNFNLSTVTTGRSTIAFNYINILWENIVCLLFGYGFSYSNYLGEATNHGAHNTYLDIILSWGCVGTIIILYFMLSIVRKYRYSKCKKSGMIEKLPLVVLMINFMDLGCLNASMFWFVFAAAIVSFKYSDMNVENVKYE